jgi:hypothetical protein
MSDKMVLLAIYGNPIEAELARAELEAEDIRACVLGAASGDVFAGMGVGVSNVQLLVPEKDYERATRLLAEESDVGREAREGRARERRRRKKRSTAIQGGQDAESGPTDIRPAVESPAQGADSPVPPAEGEERAEEPTEQWPEAEGDDDEREDRPLTWTRDDLATRAFRAALFGYLTCGLMHAYALWLLGSIPSTEGDLSPAGARKAWAALVLTLLPWLVALVAIWNALS